MEKTKDLKERELNIMKKLAKSVILPDGQQGLVVQPSPHRYDNESYGWDQAFAAWIYADLGLMNEAEKVLREMAAKINLAGFQPLVTRWESRQHNPLWNMRTRDDKRFTVLIQQPLLAQTTLKLTDEFGLINNPQLIQQATAAALVNVSFLLNKRRLSSFQLVSVIDPIETGMDSLVVWDEYIAELTSGWIPRNWRVFWGSILFNLRYMQKGWDLGKILAARVSFIVEPVSLNVFVVRELLAIARLQELLGQKDQAMFVEKQAMELAQEIEVELWDPQEKMYFPKARYPDGQWRFLRRLTVESLWPLLLPGLDLDKVEWLVKTIETKFQARYLLPASPEDPDHPKKVLGRTAIWWPGQVWANTNRFFIDALHHHAKRLRSDGRKDTADLADELAKRIDHDWEELIQRSGMREYYDQEGRGGAEKDFFWSALKITKFPMELR